MSVMQDFKKFAFKGNVVDLAVAVVIGAAFGKVITAIVADLVMPLVGLIMPGGDWRTAGVILRHAADPKNDAVLRYGDFLGATVDFLVVGLVLFAVLYRAIQAQKRAEAKKAAEAPATRECPFCLETIPASALKCKSCTADLRSPATPAVALPAVAPGRPATIAH